MMFDSSVCLYLNNLFDLIVVAIPSKGSKATDFSFDFKITGEKHNSQHYTKVGSQHYIDQENT